MSSSNNEPTLVSPGGDEDFRYRVIRKSWDPAKLTANDAPWTPVNIRSFATNSEAEEMLSKQTKEFVGDESSSRDAHGFLVSEMINVQGIGCMIFKVVKTHEARYWNDWCPLHFWEVVKESIPGTMYGGGDARTEVMAVYTSDDYQEAIKRRQQIEGSYADPMLEVLTKVELRKIRLLTACHA